MLLSRVFAKPDTAFLTGPSSLATPGLQPSRPLNSPNSIELNLLFSILTKSSVSVENKELTI
jgi:hypothetical protein